MIRVNKLFFFRKKFKYRIRTENFAIESIEVIDVTTKRKIPFYKFAMDGWIWIFNKKVAAAGDPFWTTIIGIGLMWSMSPSRRSFVGSWFDSSQSSRLCQLLYPHGTQITTNREDSEQMRFTVYWFIVCEKVSIIIFYLAVCCCIAICDYHFLQFEFENTDDGCHSLTSKWQLHHLRQLCADMSPKLDVRKTVCTTGRLTEI